MALPCFRILKVILLFWLALTSALHLSLILIHLITYGLLSQMAHMARPLASQPFPTLALSQSWHLSCHLVDGSEEYLDTNSLRKWDMNLVEVGLWSWEQFPVRLIVMGCQLGALSASESTTPSIPKEFWQHRTEFSLAQSSEADSWRINSHNGSQRQWVIPEMCEESNSQIAIRYSSIILHEWKWN